MILDPLSENILKDSINAPTLQNPFETFNINLFPSISATSSSNGGETADYTSYLKGFLSEDRNAGSAPLYDVTKEQKERYDNPYLAYTPFTQSAKTIEGVYGMYQGAGEQLLNGILKGGVKAAGTFLEAFAAVPNQLDAARKGDVSNALFAESSSFNAISNWMDSFENSLPNYLTDLEQDRPWYVNAFTPTGAANFWGDTIIKNGGFMLGAIASAAVVDGALTLATGGLGAEVALIDFGRRIGSTIPKMKSAFRGLSKVAALGKTDDVIGIMNTGENLLEATKLAKQTSTLSQIGKAGHFAATTYFSTQGEAMIEGYHTYVDTKTKLLEEAISRGETLTPELLAGIEDTASNAGKMTAIFNAAVLTPSNMIQFPKLMGWKKMTNLTKKIDSPYIKYDIQGEGLKAMNTYTRKKAVANVLKDVGLKSFLPEGLEEGAQYFIGNSLHDYYIDKFNNKTKSGMADYMLDALPKTLSEGEFWKEFFIGAISSTTFGGLIPGSEMQSTIKSNLIGAKARTDGYVSSINDNLDKFNAAAAQLTSFGELLNFDAAPTPSAPSVPKAQFDFINKHESAYKAFHRVVSDAATFGQLDNLKDSLNDLKELSLEEFNKLAYVGTGIPGGEKGVKTEAEKEEKLNQMLIEIDRIQEDLDAVEESFKINPFENKAFKSRLKQKGLKDKDIKNAAYSLFQDFKKNQVYTIGRLRNIQDTQNTYFNELKFGANLDPDSIENLKTVLLNIEDKESIDAYLSYKNRVLQSLSTQYDLYTSEGTKDPFNAKKIKAAINSLESVVSKLDQYKAKETLTQEEKEELTTLLFQEEFGESQASAAYMLDMQTLQLLKKAAEEELKRAQDNPDVAAEDLFKVVEELNDIEEQEKDITEEPEDQEDLEEKEEKEEKEEGSEEEIEFTDEELLRAAQEGSATGVPTAGTETRTETGTEDISLEDIEDEVLGSEEELSDMQNVPLGTDTEEDILDSVFEETEQDLSEQQTEDILRETEGAGVELDLTPEQIEAMLSEMPSEPTEEDIRIAKELFDYLSNVPENTEVSFKNQPHKVITIKEDVVTLLSPSNETIAVTPQGVFDFANRNVGLVEEDLQMIPDVLDSMPKFEEQAKNLKNVNARIDALTEYHKKIKASKRVVNPPFKVGQLYLASNSKVLGKTGFFVVYKFVKKEGKDNIFEKHFIKINSKGELYSRKEKNEAVKYSLVEISNPNEGQTQVQQQPTPPASPNQAGPTSLSEKGAELNKIKTENALIGQSILEKAGYKNENRLPNGNVKGGQAGWKIRFNIKNPKTGNSYYADGKSTLVDEEYNKRAETLVNFLLEYFGSGQKADSKKLEKHYIIEDKDGTKREPFKHLSGGEIGESDFTIYIGSADDVLKFISDIRTKHPEIIDLLHQGNQSGDVMIDNIFKGRIEGAKIGFSGYHVPSNLYKLVGSNEFSFVHKGDRIVVNYGNGDLSDIFVYNERTRKGYGGVFDKNMQKDQPELYKNIRNIIGFQLYGKYLTGSNNEFVKFTGVSSADLFISQQTQPQTPEQDLKTKLEDLNKKLEELNKRQDKERDALNKKEGKNYISSFDILNINEYSSDQSPRSEEAINLANRHEAELAKLIKEKRELDSEADSRIYSPYDFSGNKREFDAIKQELNKIYAQNKNALDEGFEIAGQALEEANEVGGSDYAAHGMGKATLANASESLYVLFRKGINPIRSGGLYTAPLSGGISTGETASGNAYMDGPFTLVARKGHTGFITNIEQVAGIIVNEGIATPIILDSLRSIFPDLVIESTSNTKALVEQLNEKENPNSSETVVNVAAQKVDPQDVNKNIMEFIGLKADLYAVFQNAINNNILSIKCD